MKTFNNKKILLIGDTILDVYIYVTIVGQALDAPVPEVQEVRSHISFGGNALIASHILELGGTLRFISVVGADHDAQQYDTLKHPRLTKFFLTDATRRTTVKRRWYAEGRKLLQVNNVDNHDIDARLEKKVLNLAKAHIREADLVVIMDPQHGFLTKTLIRDLVALAKKHRKPLYVDCQISHRKSNHRLYRGADCMFLNEKEALAVHPAFDFVAPEASLKLIRKKLQLKNIVVKFGAHGSVALFGNRFIRTSAPKVRTVDPCGAGDAFLAAVSLGDREQPEDMLRISNIWAALSTTIHGTIPPTKKDLITTLKNLHEDFH